MIFAAVILLSTMHCPHDEPSCLTPTEIIHIRKD
jgi:hypothetical protein